MTESGIGRVGGASGCPTVSTGVVSASGVQNAGVVAEYIRSAPDDHLAAGPHCRVIGPGVGHAGEAGGCPTVGAGIVSASGVERVKTRGRSATADPDPTPGDHLVAGPHCRVIFPDLGRAGGGSGCPSIHGGIVSPAGVRIAAAV